jgi:hypothetical protein
MTDTFTDHEKLAEVRRELKQRARVYRRLVENGKMEQSQADRFTNIMLAVEADYAARVEAEEAKRRLAL